VKYLGDKPRGFTVLSVSHYIIHGSEIKRATKDGLIALAYAGHIIVETHITGTVAQHGLEAVPFVVPSLLGPAL
jgi:hypothetical protein